MTTDPDAVPLDEFGQALSDLRAQREWSLREAARAAGMAEGTWRHYERGSRKVGTGVVVPVRREPRTIRKMAAALEVDPGPLLALAAQGSTAPPRVTPASDVIRAILEDPFLLDEAREHLVKQYGLLLRVQSTATPDQQLSALESQVVSDLGDRPRKAVKSLPRKRTSGKDPAVGR